MSRRFGQATKRDHQSFCLAEGWTQVRNARGRTGHHVTYELALPDGRVLRTRISHPPDRQAYGASLWRHILRDQLQVSESEFWACVSDGVKPDRDPAEPPESSIPAGVVAQLLASGVPEDEIRSLSRDGAIARLTEIWSHG